MDNEEQGQITGIAPAAERVVDPESPVPDRQGAYTAFVGVAALAYVGLLSFVFAFGLYGETLTAGVDAACADAAFRDGKDLESRGLFDLALQRYRQALEGHFRDEEARFRCMRSVGELLFRLERYDEAVATYRDLPPEALSEPGHWTAYVSSLLNAGYYDETERLGHIWLEKATTALDSPDQADRQEAHRAQAVWAHTTLGRLYEQTNRVDSALEHYQAAAAIAPESQAALLAARLMNQRGRRQEALQVLDALIGRIQSGELLEDARKLRSSIVATTVSQ